MDHRGPASQPPRLVDESNVAPTRDVQLGAARTDDLEVDKDIGMAIPWWCYEQHVGSHIMDLSLQCENRRHIELPTPIEDVTTDDNIVEADDEASGDESKGSVRTCSEPEAPSLDSVAPRRIWRAPSGVRPKLVLPNPGAVETTHSHGPGIASAKTGTHEEGAKQY